LSFEMSSRARYAFVLFDTSVFDSCSRFFNRWGLGFLCFDVVRHGGARFGLVSFDLWVLGFRLLVALGIVSPTAILAFCCPRRRIVKPCCLRYCVTHCYVGVFFIVVGFCSISLGFPRHAGIWRWGIFSISWPYLHLTPHRWNPRCCYHRCRCRFRLGIAVVDFGAVAWFQTTPLGWYCRRWSPCSLRQSPLLDAVVGFPRSHCRS